MEVGELVESNELDVHEQVELILMQGRTVLLFY